MSKVTGNQVRHNKGEQMTLFSLLFVLVVGVGLLAAWAGSVAWVWRDAERRGQPGFIVAVLVALLCWPLSLIVWVLARPQPTGTPPAPRSRGGIWALVAVVAVLLLFILPILLGTLLPSLAKARESAQRAACAKNVRQLALARQMYQVENGKYPKTLADLQGFVDLNKARCPASLKNAPPGYHDYELLGGTNATDIIIRENPMNHSGRGGNVAYGDGHVEWVPAALGGNR
jgi:prepilin-type processing-associated H-X9-DG protein